MASFEQHVNTAVIVTGMVVIPIHLAGILDTTQSIVALALGLIGGVLPDLDSSSSKPVQIVFKMISIFFPLMLLLSIRYHFSLIQLILAWVLITVFLHLTFFKIFLKITRHRGIFHTIPMGILFAQITAYSFYYFGYYNLTKATILGGFVLLGFLVHLLLDEIFSINALGMTMKKSFGTAFKFYDKKNMFGTLILYLLIGAIFYTIPFHENTFEHIFNVLKNVKII